MELFGIVSIAFMFGLLHALDADHILAVSGLSSMRRDSVNQHYRFYVRWAIGHGSTVLLIGGLVLLFGVVIPESMGHIAEQLVGLMLLIVGVLLLMNLHAQNKLQIIHPHDKGNLHAYHHGTMVVGSMHGVAGSATLLALLPAGGLGSPALGMAYLIIFCIGVLASMLVVGGILGRVFRHLGCCHQSAVSLLRIIIACLAIVMGLFLLVRTTA